MGLITGAGESYTLSGASGVGLHNREDLSDFITNISPTETPFFSGIGRTKATAVIHEWMTHSLAAAAATNVVVEGNEASLITPTILTRVTNQCQINQKSVGVSGTQDAVNKAGMTKELAYRVVLHGKEIKRDIEKALCNNTSGDASTGSTTVARAMKGIPTFVTTNTTTITTALTIADVNGILEDCWDEGGDPDILMGNGNTKRLLSALAHSVTGTNIQWDVNSANKQLVSAIDIWDGDFGVQKIVPNRFDATLTVKALQMDYWKLAELRPMEITTLAKTGDAERRMLNSECTLECRAENANGILTHAGT